MAARIPTILADPAIRGSGQSPASGSLGFNEAPGVQQLATGVGAIAQGAVDIAASSQQLKDRKQRDIEARWVGDAHFQAVTALSTWQADPNNNQNEDYAVNLMEYAKSNLAQYSDGAPTTRARKMLEDRMQAELLSRYQAALGVTERTRLENSKTSVISQTAQALAAYRNGGDVVDLMRHAGYIATTIDELFGDMSPEATRRLKAHVDTEVALGVANQDPERAVRVIKQSPSIDEADKPTLLNKVEALSKEVSRQNIDEINALRRNHLALAAEGAKSDKLPEAIYKGLPGGDKLKAEDDYRIDVFNRAFEITSRLTAKAGPYITSELSRLKDRMSAAADPAIERDALTMAEDQLSRVVKLQQSDRVAWLLQYNPEVQDLNSRLSGVTDPAIKSELLSKRNMAILKYQGSPELGFVWEEGDRYLGLATHDRHLMTTSEARANAAFINQGTPTEAIARINQVMANYPDQEHQYIAFTDMTGADGGIREEYQLAWQNKDQWWVQNYVAAISDSKALATLNDEKRKELTARVDGVPLWKQFEQVMVGSGREREAVAFKSGVMTFANHLQVSQGESSKNAAEKAVERLIGSTLAFTQVHGAPLMVLRQKADGTTRPDEEIQDLGRRMTMSLRDLDPRMVDQTRFPALGTISADPNNVNRLQALRDIITRTGRFVTGNDGQSATLYIVGDDGIPFELRDAQNRAFQINFDDLPAFTSQTQVPSYIPTVKSNTVETKDQPRSTYELQSYPPEAPFIDRILGTYQKKTYWPTAPYLKKTEPRQK